VANREPDPIEIEWQLDALDLRPVERWLASLEQRNNSAVRRDDSTDRLELTAETADARHLFDVYLDTGDWRIGRAGFVLRVRHRGNGDEVTLKDTAPASAGLRQRLEVTEPLPAGGVTALGASGPVGRRVRALAGHRPLRPVLEVRTTRVPTTLRSDGQAVAEVALDDTTLSVGAHEEPAHLRRVEVEAEPAWLAALEPLVEEMQRDCGLTPAALSKFEVGLLAAGVSIPGPPDLGPTAVTPTSTVGDLAFAVLRRNLAALIAHDPGTRLGEDIEELHDMRVATRRLRAALSLFADSLPVRAVHLRAELGWLAGVLGAVRDLDVQLERVGGWADEVPTSDRAALVELDAVLHRDRDEGRAALLEALDSPRYEHLVDGFIAMVRPGPSRRSMAAGTPAVVVVPDLLRIRHRAVTKAVRRARRSGLAADFHRVRIRCKRLRYALEFASDVYEDRTRPLVRSVTRVQDILGAMQDAQVATNRLRDLALGGSQGLSPATVFAMGGIAERYHVEAQRLLRKAPSRLKVLRGPQWKQLSSTMERRRAEALAPWAGPIHRPAVVGTTSGDPGATATSGIGVTATPAAASDEPPTSEAAAAPGLAAGPTSNGAPPKVTPESDGGAPTSDVTGDAVGADPGEPQPDTSDAGPTAPSAESTASSPTPTREQVRRLTPWRQGAHRRKAR
jgi:triphosphatase